METRREVRVIQVDRLCPKCLQGYLRPTGVICSANPPMRPHKCNNEDCDYGETITGNSYPYLEYEPIIHDIRIMDGSTINGSSINVIHGKGEKDFQVDVKVINDYPKKISGK